MLSLSLSVSLPFILKSLQFQKWKKKKTKNRHIPIVSTRFHFHCYFYNFNSLLASKQTVFRLRERRKKERRSPQTIHSSLGGRMNFNGALKVNGENRRMNLRISNVKSIQLKRTFETSKSGRPVKRNVIRIGFCVCLSNLYHHSNWMH